MNTLYQVFRPKTSSYQGAHLFEKEKRLALSFRQISHYAASIDDIITGLPVILFTNTHVTEEDLIQIERKAPIKLIIHPNSGYDNFTLQRLKNAPIILGNSIREKAVTEVIIAQALSWFSLPTHTSFWPKKRIWERELLSDQRVLILGHGHIGKRVKNILANLGCQVAVSDPAYELPPIEGKFHLLIIACSLNESTKNLVNKHFFHHFLTPNFSLINTARGEILHFDHLIQHLKEHPLAKAYLDVFPYEPFPLEDYSTMNNLILGPHVAGVWNNLNEEILNFESLQLQNFFETCIEKNDSL